LVSSTENRNCFFFEQVFSDSKEKPQKKVGIDGIVGEKENNGLLTSTEEAKGKQIITEIGMSRLTLLGIFMWLSCRHRNFLFF